jgi:hypothetical protein
MAGTRASAADVRPLPALVPVVGAAYGAVLVALLVADVAWPVRLALLAAFALAAAGASRHLRDAGRPHRVGWDGRGGWSLDGRAVALDPATRVYAGLVVLVVRGAEGRRERRALWVPRAAVMPADFRRLKTQLRLGPVRASRAVGPETPC